MLSAAFWFSRFAGDEAAIGRRLTLGGQPYLVVGILDRFDPEQFDRAPDVWIPFQIDPQTRDLGGEFCFITGRLKPGITRDQASAELQTVSADYAQRFPSRTAPRSGFAVIPVREAMVGDMRASLVILMASVALVLLIACADLANLLLMRGTARAREIAIRAATQRKDAHSSGNGSGRSARERRNQLRIVLIAMPSYFDQLLRVVRAA